MILLFLVLAIQLIKYRSMKMDFLNSILDLETAYEKLGLDQFEIGYTDIGGIKAKYMSKNKKDKAEMLDEYISKLQANRRRLGKEPIKYSETTKIWIVDKSTTKYSSE